MRNKDIFFIIPIIAIFRKLIILKSNNFISFLIRFCKIKIFF